MESAMLRLGLSFVILAVVLEFFSGFALALFIRCRGAWYRVQGALGALGGIFILLASAFQIAGTINIATHFGVGGVVTLQAFLLLMLGSIVSGILGAAIIGVNVWLVAPK